MNKRLLVVLTAIGVCGAIAGCGGSSSNEQSPVSRTDRPASSLAQYIDRADDLCAELDEQSAPRKQQIAEELGAISSKTTAIRAAGDLRTLAEIADADAARLRAAGPPPDHRQPIEAMLSLREEQSDLFRSLSNAVMRNDFTAEKKILARMGQNQNRYAALTDALGFQVCG